MRCFRPIFFAVVSAALVCLSGGCDSFRKLAGRPTSADIEAKRELIARENAAHQARLDSLKKVEKAKADSLELLEAIRGTGTLILSSSSLRRVNTGGLDNRYYIVVGAYSNSENASYKAGQISAAGFDPVKIPYGNGFTAVCTGGTDALSQLWDNLQRVSSEKFCPKDVWILVND